MKSMCPVDEEPYEVGLDNHGCCNGPRTGRLSVLDKVSILMIALVGKHEDVLVSPDYENLLFSFRLFFFLKKICI